MPRLVVVLRSGAEEQIEGEVGFSVMESIRRAGIDELDAQCGGCCSCATCHVYVDPAFVDQLEPLADAENDLLDCSEHRGATSRLSCQIPLTEGLDGLRVTIAPEG
ncbi:2Fe-2S iron-sulfur cluster-binding protein [Xanthobacter flavus]|uniref:2Fe-2S iron-sulfur cluster-binding protein n=1 Tax=Xanthobacter flavus TaxID=281 RepID=UPI003727718C